MPIFFLIGLALALTGCYEEHYYHEYHHHTRVWYGHHHRTPPAQINFEVDVYHRHRRHH